MPHSTRLECLLNHVILLELLKLIRFLSVQQIPQLVSFTFCYILELISFVLVAFRVSKWIFNSLSAEVLIKALFTCSAIITDLLIRLANYSLSIYF